MTAAIDARRAAWIEAVESGDADGYAALLSADVVWIPPVGDPIVGRDAFRDWVAPFLERFDYGMVLEPEAVRAGDDHAVESGSFVSRMSARDGGESVAHEGRYVVLWRRGPDGWAIERYADVTPP